MPSRQSRLHDGVVSHLCTLKRDISAAGKERLIMRVEDASRILLAGGSLRIAEPNADSAVHMAYAAKAGGAQLTMTTPFGVDDMVRIANAGKGHVCFDLVSE
jgi:hypothetical protein